MSRQSLHNSAFIYHPSIVLNGIHHATSSTLSAPLLFKTLCQMINSSKRPAECKKRNEEVLGWGEERVREMVLGKSLEYKDYLVDTYGPES